MHKQMPSTRYDGRYSAALHCIALYCLEASRRKGGPAHFMERLSDCMAKSTLPMSCLRVKMRSLTSLPLQVVKVSSCMW